MAIYIVILVVLFFLSAFFSSSETAVIASQRFRLKHLEESGVAGAGRVTQMLERPERFLSAVLTGNNFVNTAIAVLGTLIATIFITDDRLAALVATIAVTILLLIFGETVPKTIAAHHAERMALAYVGPLEIISKILSPFVAGLSWIVGKFTRGEAVPPRSLLTEEEIRTAISLGEKEGIVDEVEADMLHRVFEFRDRPVREVMTPRPEVIWIEQRSNLADFFSIYAQFSHSRFPVYQGSFDNVIGIVYIKDVLMAQARGGLDSESPISELIRPVYFVPESKPIGDLFSEMRAGNYQMAIIIDEYGGTAGIATIEELLEEIVGELGDELTRTSREFEAIDEHTYQIDGGMRIDEANEQLRLNLPDGDYETVAGLVLSLLGHIPKEGERVKCDELKLVVTQMKGMKIEKILVTKE
jgi:putative hemolysin